MARGIKGVGHSDHRRRLEFRILTMSTKMVMKELTAHKGVGRNINPPLATLPI